MLRVAHISENGAVPEFGDQALLSRWLERRDGTIWVDMEGEDKDRERNLLASDFNISPLAIDDAQRDRHPPKLERFQDYLFLLLKGFTAETRSIDFSIVHISFFVGRNFIVTRHDRKSPSINKVWTLLEQGDVELARGPGHVCYRILRTMIDRYTPIILSLESRLDELEESMLKNPSDVLLGELMNQNGKLKKLRRIFGYQQNVIAQLKNDNTDLLHADAAHEFQDAFEQMERLSSLSTMLQELTRDLMDGYISVTSHRLNNIMKLLTVASVIFLPLTFMAGIYGMNFEYMPELNFRGAYYVLLGAMVFVAILLLGIFKKVGWL